MHVEKLLNRSQFLFQLSLESLSSWNLHQTILPKLLRFAIQLSFKIIIITIYIREFFENKSSVTCAVIYIHSLRKSDNIMHVKRMRLLKK